MSTILLSVVGVAFNTLMVFFGLRYVGLGILESVLVMALYLVLSVKIRTILEG